MYDVASVRKRDQFTFGSRVVYYDFTDDSKRLVVLTEDQTLFVLNVSEAVKGVESSIDQKHDVPLRRVPISSSSMEENRQFSKSGY